MGKNTKTVLKGFDYMHCDDFAKFLMDMAAQGWHFKEWGLGLKFEKGEPEQAVYAVEVFTGASEYDTRPEPHTKAFAEYCEAAGWKLIDAKQKYVIFKRMQEDAIPILTPQERVMNAFKERRGEIISRLIVAIIFFSMQIVDISSPHFFAPRIFSPLQLSLLILWSTALVERTLRLIGLLWWKHKMNQKLAVGEPIYLGNESGKVKIFSRAGLWIALLVEVMCFAMLPEQWLWPIVALIIGGLLCFLALGMVLAKVRPESNTNFIIQIVFGVFYFVALLVVAVAFGELERQDRVKVEAPLVKEDYTQDVTELEKITVYDNKNILGRNQSYVISYEDTETDYNNGLYYDIYTSEIELLMDKIWEDQTELRCTGERTDCTKAWGAEVAFFDEQGEYFVRYENVILHFEDYKNIVLTQEQIDIIRDKLDLR